MARKIDELRKKTQNGELLSYAEQQRLINDHAYLIDRMLTILSQSLTWMRDMTGEDVYSDMNLIQWYGYKAVKAEDNEQD